VQQKEKVWCKNGPEKIDTPFVFFSKWGQRYDFENIIAEKGAF
jgi:hypothetical protein